MPNLLLIGPTNNGKIADQLAVHVIALPGVHRALLTAAAALAADEASPDGRKTYRIYVDRLNTVVGCEPQWTRPSWLAEPTRRRCGVGVYPQVGVRVVGLDRTALERGSPTITVDGEDLFATGQPPGGLSCRVYPTASGPAGVPDPADLVAALRERTHR